MPPQGPPRPAPAATRSSRPRRKPNPRRPAITPAPEPPAEHDWIVRYDDGGSTPATETVRAAWPRTTDGIWGLFAPDGQPVFQTPFTRLISACRTGPALTPSASLAMSLAGADVAAARGGAGVDAVRTTLGLKPLGLPETSRPAVADWAGPGYTADSPGREDRP